MDPRRHVGSTEFLLEPCLLKGVQLLATSQCPRWSSARIFEYDSETDTVLFRGRMEPAYDVFSKAWKLCLGAVKNILKKMLSPGPHYCKSAPDILRHRITETKKS